MSALAIFQGIEPFVAPDVFTLPAGIPAAVRLHPEDRIEMRENYFLLKGRSFKLIAPWPTTEREPETWLRDLSPENRRISVTEPWFRVSVSISKTKSLAIGCLGLRKRRAKEKDESWKRQVERHDREQTLQSQLDKDKFGVMPSFPTERRIALSTWYYTEKRLEPGERDPGVWFFGSADTWDPNAEQKALRVLHEELVKIDLKPRTLEESCEIDMMFHDLAIKQAERYRAAEKLGLGHRELPPIRIVEAEEYDRIRKEQELHEAPWTQFSDQRTNYAPKKPEPDLPPEQIKGPLKKVKLTKEQRAQANEITGLPAEPRGIKPKQVEGRFAGADDETTHGGEDDEELSNEGPDHLLPMYEDFVKKTQNPPESKQVQAWTGLAHKIGISINLVRNATRVAVDAEAERQGVQRKTISTQIRRFRMDAEAIGKIPADAPELTAEQWEDIQYRGAAYLLVKTNEWTWYKLDLETYGSVGCATAALREEQETRALKRNKEWRSGTRAQQKMAAIEVINRYDEVFNPSNIFIMQKPVWAGILAKLASE